VGFLGLSHQSFGFVFLGAWIFCLAIGLWAKNAKVVHCSSFFVSVCWFVVHGFSCSSSVLADVPIAVPEAVRMLNFFFSPLQYHQVVCPWPKAVDWWLHPSITNSVWLQHLEISAAKSQRLPRFLFCPRQPSYKSKKGGLGFSR
jgi:hypothetical protein